MKSGAAAKSSVWTMQEIVFVYKNGCSISIDSNGRNSISQAGEKLYMRKRSDREVHIAMLEQGKNKERLHQNETLMNSFAYQSSPVPLPSLGKQYGKMLPDSKEEPKTTDSSTHI